MAGNVVDIKDAGEEPQKRTPAGWHRFWARELSAADKRLKTFTKQGNGVVERFRNTRVMADASLSYGDNNSNHSLNLFWSNITTLQSMLYGATPQTDVSREHHDPDDDVARVASVLFQRMLQADVENPSEDLPTALKSALQDRLLPGLGVCRVRYEYETSKVAPQSPAAIEGQEPEDLASDAEPTEQVDYECAPIDYIHWQDFRWGWGRTWSEIPWLGFRSWLTKREAGARFGKKVAAQLEYKNQLPSGDDNKDTDTDPELKNNVQKAEIWEFWEKKTGKVYWYSQGAELILDAMDDPLKLEGFWPCPRPLTANLTTTLFIPKADYCMAQDLYNEIDVLQARISNLTRAVKVVGVYDQSAGASVGRMLSEGNESDMIPVENWAMFAEGGGLKGKIDWFPVEDVVNTLNTLIGIRDQTIGLLHEVTGQSDIIRGGDTDQYTSDGTNQLKAKFGSIRIQALQDEFARFASDTQRLKAEVIAKHFRPESIIRQSSAQFLPKPDLDKVGPAVQLMQSPDVKWRVTIRPESIAMIDYAQLKSERTEYLTAMSTFIQSAGALVSNVPQAMPLMLEFMKFGMVGFKGSDYMEGILDQAIDQIKKSPPKPPDDGKAQQAQADMQAAQQQHQFDMEKLQAKAQIDAQTNQQKHQMEMQTLMAESQRNIQEIAASNRADLQKIAADHAADMASIMAKLSSDTKVEQVQSGMAIAETHASLAADSTLSAQQHEERMQEIDEQGKVAASKPKGKPNGPAA